jgi:hypothetical protein
MNLEAGQASGGWFKNFGLAWGAKKEGPKDDGKKFPLRIFHLVDVSSSMGKTLLEVDGNPTRLDHVKDSIQELLKQIPDNLKAGIEHVLIPYGENTGTIQRFDSKDEKGFIKAVTELSKTYGTNIFKPINEVINFIKNSNQDNFRNLAILFSDGHHIPREKDAESEEQAKDRFKDLEASNTSVFNIGVGSSYKRSFMLDSLNNAKHGGLAHIPNSRGDTNIYREVLPSFIQDLTSAPQYPVIAFNKFFDQVINMNPTARKVARTDGHFEAIAGYQTEAFNVGFIEEEKIDEARIFKMVKEKANSETISENEELTIQDIDDVPLDPNEREQYKEYLLLAIKNLLLESKEPAKLLEDFFEENNFEDDILQYLKEELGPILNKFHRKSMDAQEEMSYLASQSVSINRTIMDGVPVPVENEDLDQGGINTLQHNISQTQVASINQCEQIAVNDLESVIEVANADLKEVTLSFTTQKGEEIGSFDLKEKGSNLIVIGRAEQTDLRINNKGVSRHHAEIHLKEGKVYITDQDSMNGTKLNGNLIEPHVATRLKPQDTITIGSQVLRVNFEQT